MLHWGPGAVERGSPRAPVKEEQRLRAYGEGLTVSPTHPLDMQTSKEEKTGEAAGLLDSASVTAWRQNPGRGGVGGPCCAEEGPRNAAKAFVGLRP